MAKIELSNIMKKFGRTTALNDINLNINDSEFFVLFGPAGAGKTTTLKIIAGIETPDEGIIKFDEEIVNGLPPSKRDIAFVFENYALYPNLSVFDNIASPLRSPAHRKEEEYIRRRVIKVAETLGMENFLDRLPTQLSNGQRQRVALGRALIREEPKAFLLDEPLAHLDAKLRNQMRTELKAIKSEFKGTVLYVTHEYSEALGLGDRIGVIKEGKIIQIGSPDELYFYPINEYVAQLFGDPEINILNGSLVSKNNKIYIELFGKLYEVKNNKTVSDLVSSNDRKVKVGLRGNDFSIITGAEINTEQRNLLEGNVYNYEVSGNYSVLTLQINNQFIEIQVPVGATFKLGEKIPFLPNIEKAIIFDNDGNFLTYMGEKQIPTKVK